MAKAVKTIGVLTSEGGAPGMNATIRAVVRTAINKGLKIKGIMRRYAGLLEEKIVDIKSINASDIIDRGGAILYTARCKESATAEGQQKGVDICRKHGIDGVTVIGEDGPFRDVGKLSSLGTNTIGLPGTIDLDIVCTDYTTSFDTAISTVTEVADKIRGTSTSHERYNIVEVMGRNTGYIALWCGTRSGAEDIPLPERYDGDEQALINRIVDNRRRGREHNIIINTEGIGHSGPMAKRIGAITGVETRATILGRMQRGRTPTCKDRVYAPIMGAKAAELPTAGKSNRLVAYKYGGSVDFDTQEAPNMIKDISREQYEIAEVLIRQSGT